MSATMADPELAQLLVRVAQADRRALKLLYDRQATRLFGVANAILRDRDAAADAMQEAFLRVFQRAGQFDPARGAAEAWLGSIVRHAALDLARKRGREMPSDDPALGDTPVPPVALEQLAAAGEQRRLQDCLARLEHKHRQSIVLAFVEGHSHAQIAARLDIPLGTIKAWIRRGLLQLRECMA